jgi:RHS repeat-associated protein
LADRQGSIIGITTSTGSQSDRVTYDAFGNKLSESAPTVTGNYDWQGMQFDSNTGLYHTPNREYAVATGKWLQVDPIMFRACDANLYRVVGNDVTNATDYNGTDGHSFWNNQPNNPSVTQSAQINTPDGKAILSAFSDYGITTPKGNTYDHDVCVEYHGLGAQSVRFIQLCFITTDLTAAQVNALPPITSGPGGKPVVISTTASPVWMVDNPPQFPNDALWQGMGAIGYPPNYTWLFDDPNLAFNLARNAKIKYKWDYSVPGATFVVHFVDYALFNQKAVGRVEWTDTATWRRPGGLGTHCPYQDLGIWSTIKYLAVTGSVSADTYQVTVCTDALGPNFNAHQQLLAKAPYNFAMT